MSKFKTHKHHIFLSMVLTIFFTHATYAVDLSFRLTPEIVLPVSQKKSIAIDQSYGGIINADFNLFNFLTVGPELSLNLFKTDYSTDFNSVFGTGISAGVFYAPIKSQRASRLSISI